MMTETLTDDEINERLAILLNQCTVEFTGGFACTDGTAGNFSRRVVPDYLSDWNGAQRVVEALLARGWAVYMQSVAGWGHQCSVTEKDGSKILGHMTRADTLPRALALAALQALEA